jgi:hypothetical protein
MFIIHQSRQRLVRHQIPLPFIVSNIPVLIRIIPPTCDHLSPIQATDIGDFLLKWGFGTVGAHLGASGVTPFLACDKQQCKFFFLISVLRLAHVSLCAAPPFPSTAFSLFLISQSKKKPLHQSLMFAMRFFSLVDSEFSSG